MESIGIPFSTLENDYALNWQFSDNGYESKLFLKNAGSSIFLLVIFISFWGLLLFFTMLSLISNKMKTIKLIISKNEKSLIPYFIQYLFNPFTPLHY